MNGPPEGLDGWVLVARAELDAAGVVIDAEVVDVAAILDLARDAAHSIARPAAPLTTFLLGYAAARAGGGREGVRTLATLLSTLAIENATAAQLAADSPPSPGPVS